MKGQKSKDAYQKTVTKAAYQKRKVAETMAKDSKSQKTNGKSRR